ncbi:MAG: Cell division protein FtsX [Gammaproteobacteria bacterium]|nr:Cell division protein FtsX [Gammaproteobacteria bacterium]
MTRPAAKVTPRQRSGIGAGGLGAWLRAHRAAIAATLQQFARQPLAHGLTVAVLAVTLALPIGLYVVLANVARLTEAWDTNQTRMSVFLKTNVDDAQARRLAASVSGSAGIANVRVISRAEALDEYRAYSGFNEAIDAIGGNPLPAVLVIDPGEGADLQAIVARLRSRPEVDTLKFDMEWVQRLQAMTALGQRAVRVIAGVLAVAVLLIAGNAIRVAVAQRREEIEVYKLVGATDAYIRRPFLYTGWLYGALAGLLACGGVAAMLAAVRAPARRLAQLYQSAFELNDLAWPAILVVMVAAGFVGLLGAWWTAAHHIRRIDVR